MDSFSPAARWSSWRSWFRWLAVGGLCVAAGCGSKTGLRVPDVSFEGPDATDAVDSVCVPGVFQLVARGAQVMFLVDRSNSMRANLDGSADPPSRWTVFRDELGQAILPVENQLALGALFFPIKLGVGADRVCEVAGQPDVDPAFGAAQSILAVFDSTMPFGGTPTADAITNARTWMVNHHQRGLAPYLVLATDGGPNCNTTFEFQTCACTFRDPITSLPNCDMGPEFAVNCLDDDRTLQIITSTAESDHIPVFVIGVDDATRPDLQDVLDRMAVAGGRPIDPGGRQYYSIRRQGDLQQALQTIQQAIAQCTYVAPAHAADLAGMVLMAGSTVLPQDPTRRNGWDWTNLAEDELTLFGAACDTARLQPPVTAQVGCTDGGSSGADP